MPCQKAIGLKFGGCGAPCDKLNQILLEEPACEDTYRFLFLVFLFRQIYVVSCVSDNCLQQRTFRKQETFWCFPVTYNYLGGLYCKYIFDFIILARSRDIFLHHHLRNKLLSSSEKACQNLIMTFWNDDSRKEEGRVIEEGWGVRRRRERNKRGNWIWKREARLKKAKANKIRYKMVGVCFHGVPSLFPLLLETKTEIQVFLGKGQWEVWTSVRGAGRF